MSNRQKLKDKIRNEINDKSVKAIFLIGEKGLGKSYLFEEVIRKTHYDFVEINLELAKQGNILNPFFHALNLKNDASIYDVKQHLASIENIVFFVTNTFINHELISIFNQTIKYKSHLGMPLKFVFEINDHTNKVTDAYAELFNLNESSYVLFDKVSDDEIHNFINKYAPTKVLSKFNKKTIIEKSMGNYNRCSNIIRFLNWKLSREKALKLNENTIEELLIEFELKSFESEIYEFLKITSLTTISQLIYPIVLEEVYNIENVKNKLINISEISSLIRPFEKSNEFFIFTSALIINKLQSDLDPTTKAKLIKYLIFWLESLTIEYKTKNSTAKIGLIDIYEKLVSLNNEFNIRNSCDYYFQLFFEYKNQMTFHMAVYWYEKYLENCNEFRLVEEYYECIYKLEQYDKCLRIYNDIIALHNDDEIKVKIGIIYARVFYQKGDPEKCLEILNNIKKPKNNLLFASILSLKSSTFDWLNKDKEKRKAYKKALLLIDNDLTDEAYQLKLELGKKITMISDFSLKETQIVIKKCFEQYKVRRDKINMMEVSHNIGTNYIFLMDLDQAKRYLQLSKETMNQISSDKVYMHLNSLGILYSVSGKFYEALELFQSINTNIIEPFSRYAVILNAMMCKIKINEITLEEIEIIETELNDKKNVSNPDLILQRRNVILLKALYYKHLNKTTLANFYFEKALNYKKYRPDSYANRICSYNLKGLKSDDFMRANNENYFFLNDLYHCEVMFWG